MKYQYIIFDFDGVLVESNEIRFNGFRKLFREYPKGQVEQLVNYSKANGGVSRPYIPQTRALRLRLLSEIMRNIYPQDSLNLKEILLIYIHYKIMHIG